MSEKYRTISYYQDEGYTLASVINGAIDQSSRIFFKIYFARPNLFRFELRYQFGTKDNEKLDILWSDGKRVSISSDGKIDNIESIDEGMARLAGISLGSSVFVPSLLYKTKNNFVLSDLVNLNLERIEERDNNSYWVISGKHPRKETLFHLWIRKEDFVLYKLTYKIGAYGPQTMIEEIHQNISINRVIPQEYFLKERSITPKF